MKIILEFILLNNVMSYIDEISARINQVITHFAGGNVSKFSRMIDVISDTVTTYLGKKGVIRMPGAEFISKMVDILGISSEWILLGKGEISNNCRCNCATPTYRQRIFT